MLTEIETENFGHKLSRKPQTSLLSSLIDEKRDPSE